MTFPKKLYGAMYNKSNDSYSIETFVLIEESKLFSTYHLQSNPIHCYKIEKLLNGDFKIFQTFHTVSNEEKELVEEKAEIAYSSQPEYSLFYNEESPIEYFIDEIYDELFGIIMYPKIIKYSKSQVKSFIKKELIAKYEKQIILANSTIQMYKDDMEKAKNSFNKIEESGVVEELVFGTELYKYVPSVGVLKYKVIGSLDIDITDRDHVGKIYHIQCLSCNHHYVCTMWIAKLFKDSYIYVFDSSEDSSHKHFHTSNETLFHTNNITSYKEYLDKIKDYNNKVIDNCIKNKESYESLLTFLKL